MHQARSRHPRTGGTALLLPTTTTTELFTIDVVSQYEMSEPWIATGHYIVALTVSFCLKRTLNFKNIKIEILDVIDWNYAAYRKVRDRKECAPLDSWFRGRFGPYWCPLDSRCSAEPLRAIALA